MLNLCKTSLAVALLTCAPATAKAASSFDATIVSDAHGVLDVRDVKDCREHSYVVRLSGQADFRKLEELVGQTVRLTTSEALNGSEELRTVTDAVDTTDATKKCVIHLDEHHNDGYLSHLWAGNGSSTLEILNSKHAPLDFTFKNNDRRVTIDPQLREVCHITSVGFECGRTNRHVRVTYSIDVSADGANLRLISAKAIP